MARDYVTEALEEALSKINEDVEYCHEEFLRAEARFNECKENYDQTIIQRDALEKEIGERNAKRL